MSFAAIRDPMLSAARERREKRNAALLAEHREAGSYWTLPFAMRQAALDRFRADAAASGYGKAVSGLASYMRGTVAPVRTARPVRDADRIAGRDRLEPWSSDASVRAWAARRAGEAATLCSRTTTGADDAYAALVTYTGGFGIEPARPLRPDDPVYVAGAVRRMIDVRWWRRQARRTLTRRIEREELAAGRVHCRAGVYMSDKNVRRGLEAAQRNAETLARTEAVNECGEVFNLGELAEKSISNPRLCFAEMMVRVKGLEQIADRLGWVGTFETWTLSSRFHARLSGSGAQNPTWDGSGPRVGQDYLCTQWAKLRALLRNVVDPDDPKKKRRVALPYFGLRVAEPHHDGTPHWHLLIWTPLRWLGHLRAAMHRYALADTPDEPGAAKHRHTSETIDKAKGSAAGYLVKYVAKNTHAEGLDRALDRDGEGRDHDLGEAADKALRARLWARTHGIRQFQFFGAPPIGVYREFRRLREPVTADEKPTWGPSQLELFETARSAADESRYGDFVEACGGIERRRFALHKEAAGDNVYGEPGREIVKGIVFAAGGTPVVTRVHEWTILQGARRADDHAPWTRVSNCNRAEQAQGVSCDDEEESHEARDEFAAWIEASQGALADRCGRPAAARAGTAAVREEGAAVEVEAASCRDLGWRSRRDMGKTAARADG